MKLGELLVNSNMITVTQLQQALKSQKVYGGKLGTNLVELGLITETQLTQFLAKQLKMAAAQPADFSNIRADVLALVPRELAKQYRLVPIALAQHKLKVAFSDPLDLEAREKIAFRAGHSIIPLIAPEVLINYALEKFYGIANEKRFLKIDDEHESENSIEHLIVRTADMANEITDTGAPKQMERNELIATVGHYNLDMMSQELFQATSKEQVFRALVRYLEVFFPIIAIFINRQQEIWGWSHQGFEGTNNNFRQRICGIQDKAAITDVFQHKDLILNAILSPLDKKILKTLHANLELPYHLFPIMVGGMVVASFLVSPGDPEAVQTPPPYKIESIQEAMLKTSLALQMVALRRKIIAKS